MQFCDGFAALVDSEHVIAHMIDWVIELLLGKGIRQPQQDRYATHGLDFAECLRRLIIFPFSFPQRYFWEPWQMDIKLSSREI